MDRRSCPKLRVLIAGQQDSFIHILATNIQCWGYQVTINEGSEIEGDVLLYDLDESSRISTLMGGVGGPLTIALSSDSVSSTTLEQIGAIAMLQKPFEMGRLQYYLRVFRRLLLEREENHAGSRQVGTTLEDKESIYGPGKPKRRILVVDDDPAVANMIRNCLMFESKYEVAVARDGLKALEQCLDWRPHCIITDLIMPWMNGYQFIRCLSASSLQIMPAFVIMSASTHLEVPVDRSYLRGKVVAYVDKPFAIDHLLNAVEQACMENV